MAFLLPSRQIVTSTLHKGHQGEQHPCLLKAHAVNGTPKSGIKADEQIRHQGTQHIIGTRPLEWGRCGVAPVLAASLHTMTEMPATSATSRQSTNENALKRVRRTTSSRSATPAVMA